MIQSAINVLGTITVGICAVLLLLAYGRVRKRLLLWSGLCFAGLTASNAMLFIDLVIVPDVSLYTWRLGTAAISMIVLLYGLVFESD